MFETINKFIKYTEAYFYIIIYIITKALYSLLGTYRSDGLEIVKYLIDMNVICVLIEQLVCAHG